MYNFYCWYNGRNYSFQKKEKPKKFRVQVKTEPKKKNKERERHKELKGLPDKLPKSYQMDITALICASKDKPICSSTKNIPLLLSLSLYIY